MLDKSKLLGFRLIEGEVNNNNPYISSKIGDSAPIEAFIVADAAASVSIQSQISDNESMLNFVDNLGNETGKVDNVTYFFPPTQSDLDKQREVSALKNNVWADISYGFGKIEGKQTTFENDYESYSVKFGTNLYEDYSNGNIFGVFAGYDRLENDINSNQNPLFDSESEQDYYKVGYYGKMSLLDNLGLTYVSSVGYAEIDGTSLFSTADTDAIGYDIGGELTYDLVTRDDSSVSFSPFLSVQYASFRADDFTDSNNVVFDTNELNRLFGTVGFKTSANINLIGDNASIATLKVGYTNEMLNDNSFTTLNNIAVVRADDINNDFVKVNFDLPIALGESSAITINYSGLHNNHVNDNVVAISYGYRW